MQGLLRMPAGVALAQARALLSQHGLAPPACHRLGLACASSGSARASAARGQQPGRTPGQGKGVAQAAAGDAPAAWQEDHKPQTDALKAEAEKRFTEAWAEVENMQVGEVDDQGSAALSLQQKLQRGIAALQAGLFERDTEVRLLLLAALAGEHILFIGPPGTAKSVLGRRLASLCDGAFFERLLTRFSVPEELFGPLSMRELEADRYTRQTQGYLPTASVAFIDEIFKANSAILNTLLTVLNERLFDNGTERLPIPLICLVGASNELPESEELDALYDRFLLRRQVQQVSLEALPQLLSLVGREGDPGGGTGGYAQQSLAGPEGAGGAVSRDESAAAEEAGFTLTQAELTDIRQRAPKETAVPEEVAFLLTDLRDYLQNKCEPPIYVSDRRLVKALRLMQVAAYTSGRRLVSAQDCLLLQHIMWDKPDQFQKISDWLTSRLSGDDGAPQLDNIIEGLYQKALSVSKTKGSAAPESLLADLDNVKRTLQAKLIEAGASESKGKAVRTRGKGGGYQHSLWLSPEEADAQATAARPKLEKSVDTLTKLLFEVVTLQAWHASDEGQVLLADLYPERWAKYIHKKVPKYQ